MTWVPKSSRGVLVIVGIVLALLLYPLVHMLAAWALGVVLIGVVLFVVYVLGMRLYLWAIGA